MILVWLILLMALLAAPGWLPGVLGLAAALYILTAGVLPEISAAQYVVLALFVLAAPAAAYIAGALLDSFALSRVRGSHFSQAAVVLALCLMLQSEGVFDHLEAALMIVQQADVRRLVTLSAAAVSALLFCGGIVAFFAAVLHLLVEMPVLWLKGATRAQTVYAFAALRPLSVLIGVSLFFTLILRMFAGDLRPLMIASGVGGQP